jgi:hypothetical protein
MTVAWDHCPERLDFRGFHGAREPKPTSTFSRLSHYNQRENEATSTQRFLRLNQGTRK